MSSGSLAHTSPYGARTVTRNEGMEFQNVMPDSLSGQKSNEKARKTRPVRRFQPEPVESIKRSRRRPTGEPAFTSTRRETPRKFLPQLIETGKRSFRRADAKQGLESPHRSRRSTQSSLSAASDHSASDSEASRSFPAESRFSYTNLLQRQEGRRHSFRVPDLPAIPSNSSEDSDDSGLPSRSTSPTGLSQKDTKFSTMNDQFRESCDERFSSYLLSLAARCAEKQLRDQALAAFPNEQDYQPVSHFAIDGDEDSDNERKTFRRESTTDITWELEEMRRHKEVAESKDGVPQGREGNESRFSAAAIASRQLEQSTPLLGGWQKDNGLKHMRHAASPPMLGHDIVFPMSISPQGTTYEEEEESHHFEERNRSRDGDRSTGLWTAYPHGEIRSGKGLWNGLCRMDEGPDLSRYKIGIVTPRPDIDGDSYFSSNQAAHSNPDTQYPAKPWGSGSRLGHVDKMTGIETEVEREFHDGFVSQVYNYLSLGYPSLARYYDHELSKISGISINDLRKDDLHTDAMGYVGVPDRSRVDKDRTILNRCMRWSALRLYIHEWAKQRPEMVSNGESLDAWGVRERRGSWAI
ncbi:hypothetical protein PISL3812_06928 [Talaromyces islandicus]|uniref:Uncharacterized protein n=1 Tax=Talaromyces islandicus TaxID=28573 RepID=A0A0U1M2U5_TALIS|nr:hypothetical protein PISL3812_06928 [Talaromyces islandicus]